MSSYKLRHVPFMFAFNLMNYCLTDFGMTLTPNFFPTLTDTSDAFEPWCLTAFPQHV
jgi:hypothetical protein